MALSALFLGESVGLVRWVAGGIGFLGVILALDPTTAAVSGAALIALAGATLFACGIVATRKLRRTEWQTLVAQQFFGAGLIGATTLPLGWVQPSLPDLALMFAIGSISMTCFIAINKSLTLADASALAPFHYTSIVWAAVIGWLVWGRLPLPAGASRNRADRRERAVRLVLGAA